MFLIDKNYTINIYNSCIFLSNQLNILVTLTKVEDKLLLVICIILSLLDLDILVMSM